MTVPVHRIKEALHEYASEIGANKSKLVGTLQTISDRIVNLEALPTQGAGGRDYADLKATLEDPQYGADDFEKILKLEWEKLNAERVALIAEAKRAEAWLKANIGF